MDFDSNQAWPPVPRIVTSRLAEWAAWYDGSPQALTSAYGAGAGPRLSPRIQAAQSAGGIIGGVARAFWGRPSTFGNPREKAHLPLAGDLASLSAALLFGDRLSVDVADDQDRDRLDKILAANHLDQLLPEAAHACAGLGGVCLRATWDTSVADHALVDVFHADQAIPEWSHRILKSVTFWEQLESRAGVVTRYLETHERGRVRHRVYRGTAEQLGTLVPLDQAAYPQLQGIVLTNEDYVELPDPSMMTAAYIPNQRPAPFWRGDSMGRMLGVADVSGIEPLLGDADEVWNAWMREIRVGKARVLIARSMLDTNGPGGGMSFDADREVFESFSFAQGPDAQFSQMLQVVQPQIRHDAFAASLHEAMVQAVQSAGYSPYAFGLGEAVGGTTATEVDSRDARTNRTREAKTRYWTPALNEFLTTLSRLDAHLFGGQPVDVTVEFPSGDVETPQQTAQTLQMIRAAQASSIRTRVETLHPDWTPDQIDKEVTAIYLEEGLAAPPADVFLPDAPTNDDLAAALEG